MNIPFMDDFDAILGFLNKYISTVSIKEKLSLLFSQHNEHRLLIPRLIFLLQYSLSGKVDFRYIIIIANFALILIGFVMFKLFKVTSNKLFYYCPAVLIFFQLQYWQGSTWAQASLANMYVLLFAFLSIYALTKTGKISYIFSIVFALAATFTHGNGILAFAAGAAILLCQNIVFHQKRTKELLLWLGIAFLSFFVYFHNYTKPSYHPLLIYVFSRPIQILIYFFTLLGSGVDSYFFSGLFGLVIFLLFIYAIFYLLDKERLPFLGMIFFLVLTLILVTITRSGFGIQQAFSSRYRINTSLIYSLLYLVYISSFKLNLKKEKYILTNIILFAFIFNVISFEMYLPNIISRKDALTQAAGNWNSQLHLIYPDQEKAKNILLESSKLGIYNIDKR